jgi:hypothetical protein
MCFSGDGTMQTVCKILPNLNRPGALAPRWVCFFRIVSEPIVEQSNGP